jgi:quercetin dioxygenase-like cupin family protein
MTTAQPRSNLTAYPDWIRGLPQAAVEFPGAMGYLLSGDHGQVVLWSFEGGGFVPVHEHGPQIGVVLAGMVRMRRANGPVEYGAGESFSLDDCEPHGAEIAPGTLVIEVFAEADRHRARSS